VLANPGIDVTQNVGPIDESKLTIRDYVPADQPKVSRLYTEGLLAGQIPPNDTGADIENIEEEYMRNERAHFWIAEYEGEAVGMIGVAEDEPNHAEIRRLRVEPRYQSRGVAVKLLETALGFCHHHGYLKVVLDTRLETSPGAAIAIFDRFAFQHTRTRTVQGKEVVEFYLDLYREPKADDEEEEQ